MKAEHSDLVFKDLWVWRHEVEFLPAEEEESELPEKMKQELQELPIEVDFSNYNEESDNRFHIALKIGIEPPKIDPPKKGRGYRIELFIIGLFELNPKGLSDEHYKNLRYFSALNLMISNARERIRQSTQELPLGAYFLPPLDLKDLIRKKREEAENKKNDR